MLILESYTTSQYISIWIPVENVNVDINLPIKQNENQQLR